jgi:hypothetical protein
MTSHFDSSGHPRETTHTNNPPPGLSRIGACAYILDQKSEEEETMKRLWLKWLAMRTRYQLLCALGFFCAMGAVLPDPPVNHEARAAAQAAVIEPVCAKAAPTLIRLNGWTCDNIQRCSRSPWSGNWRVLCNGGRYSYTISDRGGRLVTTLN